jgi:hypothetical protein
MPEKSYIIDISENIFIRVYFITNKNNVDNYIVKLASIIDGEVYEIVRFDSYHNRARMDIISPDGSVSRKVWLSDMDAKTVLTNSIAEIQKNYEIYIERFIKWLKEKKNNLKEIMEMLNFYGAREITKEDMEKNPKLQKAIESDRKWLQEHMIKPEKVKKVAIIK